MTSRVGQLAPTTLTTMLHDLVARRGDQPLLAVPGPDGTEQVTAAEFAEEVDRAAAGLTKLGLRKGEVLAVWLPNLPEWLVLEFAAARLGLVVAAVNSRFRAKELAEILRTSRAKGIVLPLGFLGIDFLGILREACGRHVDLAHIITVAVEDPRAPAPARATAYRSLLADERSAPAAGNPEDLVNVFSTSGTTGAPKLAAHTQHSVVRHAYNVAAAFDLNEGDVGLCAIPLCGVFGFNWALAILAAGAVCVLPRTFDPAECADLMRTWHVSHFTGADNMLRAVLALPDLDPGELRAWKRGGFANFTGSPLQLVREIEAQTGARISGVYGASECFALVSTWPPDAPDEQRALGGGVVVDPEIAVRAADPETGAVRGHEQSGELQFRGYHVMDGYYRNPDKTAEAFTADGWYRTGDLGYTLAEGRFVYLSRLKDSLRLRGFLVDPIEIEEYLNQHEAVRFSQVVGVAGEEGGDVAVAFVQPAPGAEVSVDQLRQFCRAGIANYKVPARFEIVAGFPTVMGPNGEKIQKTQLREMAAELLGAATVSTRD